MRLLVMFDLPTTTKKEIKAYTKFRKKLLENGFYMYQYSIYTRVVKGVAKSNKFVSYIEKIAPKNGSIRVLEITDKQFSDIKIIVGEPKKQEKNGQKSLFEI